LKVPGSSDDAAFDLHLVSVRLADKADVRMTTDAVQFAACSLEELAATTVASQRQVYDSHCQHSSCYSCDGDDVCHADFCVKDLRLDSPTDLCSERSAVSKREAKNPCDMYPCLTI
jgi:hypothetical protein